MLLGVDVGGTYTDAVLIEGSAVHTAKVPSTPAEQSLGVLAAVREVLARACASAADVERFAHGMTVATNALLEGRSARTALVATEGFTDVIELGRQDRPHLYRLDLAAPEPLVPAELRFAAPERMGPDGPIRVLQEGPAAELVAEIARSQPEAVAVSLLHSYAHPAHEQLIGDLLEQAIPGANICLSSELVGTFREFERTATTVLDAALSPLLAGYLANLGRRAQELGLAEPQVMQSSGGLIDASRAGAHAALTVLSGPAGGVGGALLLAELAKEPRVLCFDMGGTSCDVCLIDGYEVAETAERSIAGRPLSLPALDIHTVGAGGGSIAWRDPGGALRVGPASAGADPGPACYGRGGSAPTVTDANLLLGRLPGDSPLAGGLVLDGEAAERAIAGLAAELGLESTACAAGIVRIAETEMLGALRLMTVERGIDPRDFALMPFGGAGPLHAAALAEALGISRILCPGASGVLCALGLAAAAPRRDVSRTLLLSGDSLTAERLSRERRRLLAEVTRQLGGGTPVRVRLRQELRYRGQSFELPVDDGPLDPGALGEAFARAHEQRYGYSEPDGVVELVTMRLSAWGASPELSLRAAGGQAGAARAMHRMRFGEELLEGEILLGAPPPGSRLAGPCLCALPEATLLVPPAWQGEVDIHGTIRLQRRPEAGS